MIGAEQLFGPLDGARALALRRLGRVAGWWARRRQDRVALVFTFGILTSLATAVLAPRWALALGPLILGVPHILADARYLIARPGYHRRRALIFATVPAMLIGLATSQLIWAAVAAAGAVAVARGSLTRKALALLGAGGLLAACVFAERATMIAFAHLHNVIGIALWWVLRPRGREMLPLALLALCAGGIAAGSFDPLFGAAHLPPLGATMRYHAAALAPGLEAPWGMRVAVLFAFAQSVHYVVWLRLIPEDARERAAPRSFTSSWRALVRDLGPVVVALFVVAAVALACWAVRDVTAARAGYLRFAVVHGHLEVVAAALFLVEGVPGRPPRTPTPRGGAAPAGPTGHARVGVR